MRKLLLVLSLLFVSSANVHAQADFYKGKTIMLVIGYSAAGNKLETLAREVVAQPPAVITRMNVVLGK